MGFENLFIGVGKVLTITTVVTLLVAQLGLTVSGYLWWFRIEPWFGHGTGTGRIVFIVLVLSWFFAFVGFLFLLFTVFFKWFMEHSFNIILGHTSAKISYVLVMGSFIVISFVCGFYVAQFGIRSNGDNNKCKNYVNDGITKAEEWASNNGKGDEYENWANKHGKQIYTSEKGKSIGNNEEELKLSNYVCEAVAVPVYLFAILEVVGVVLFICTVIYAMKKN